MQHGVLQDGHDWAIGTEGKCSDKSMATKEFGHVGKQIPGGFRTATRQLESSAGNRSSLVPGLMMVLGGMTVLRGRRPRRLTFQAKAPSPVSPARARHH